MNTEKIKQEQDEFRSASSSFLGRGIEAMTSPFAGVISKTVPSWLVEKIVKGIDAAANKPQLGAFDHDIDDMAACQKAAGKIESRAKLANGATGAASGIGGAWTMGLDIPATIGLSLRNIKDIGRAYGYEGEGVAEQIFRLQILEIAALNDKELRRQRIADLESTIGEDGELIQPETEVAQPLIDQAIERVSRAMALAIPRKKAGAIMPIIGAVISGFVNSSFQGDISAAARFAFQERRLKEKTNLLTPVS